MNARSGWLLCITLALSSATAPARAQSGYGWRPDDRVLVTSFADVRALARDFRSLYVATAEGLLIYDPQARRWQAPITIEDGYPAAEGIVAMSLDSVSGDIWLRTAAALWYRWSFGASRFDQTGAFAPPSIASGANGGRAVDPSLASFRATLGLDARARRWPLTAVVPDDRPDRFWFGTRGAFLFHFDALRGQPDWLWYGSASRGTSAIALDDRGIWFGADGLGPRAGVARSTSDLQAFELFESLDGAPSGRVNQILRVGQTMYFAATDGLFARNQDGRWQLLSREETTSVAALGSVLGSAIWVGTRRGAVRIGTAGHLLAGQRVNRVRVLGDTLWLASDAGLFSLAPRDSADDAFLNRVTRGLPGSAILDVVRAGNADFVLSAEGVYTRRGDTWVGPDRTASFVGLGRLRRLAAADSALWIAGDNGVARYAPAGGTSRVFLAPVDLPAGPVLDVLEVGDQVWLATPAGALRLRWRQ